MKKSLVIMLIAVAFLAVSCNKKEAEPQSQAKTEEVAQETQKSETGINNNAGASTSGNEKTINSAKTSDKKESSDAINRVDNEKTGKYPIVTFIELGSVSCIPCKKMQPIMKSLESKYGDQLKVIFYDVMKSENKEKSTEYAVRLIPTQVFLDAGGKEIHRHEGYYPEEDIDKFLQSNGLKINN